MRQNANCFACGAKIDLLDEESYSLMTTATFHRPRVICADVDCELAFERGPEPQDDTPFLDTSFDDHELMKDDAFLAGSVASYKRDVNNSLSIGLSQVLGQEVAR